MLASRSPAQIARIVDNRMNMPHNGEEEEADPRHD